MFCVRYPSFRQIIPRLQKEGPDLPLAAVAEADIEGGPVLGGTEDFAVTEDLVGDNVADAEWAGVFVPFSGEFVCVPGLFGNETGGCPVILLVEDVDEVLRPLPERFRNGVAFAHKQGPLDFGKEAGRVLVHSCGLVISF